MELPLVLGRDSDWAIGDELEKIRISFEPQVNSDFVDMEGKVFCLVDDRHENRRRTTIYVHFGDEWITRLQCAESPL